WLDPKRIAVVQGNCSRRAPDGSSQPSPGEISVIQVIRSGEALLAIIVRDEPWSDGIRFLTPHDLSQQFAVMRHPRGKRIEPHIHKPVPRSVQYTQEVLIVRKGRVRVDFFDNTEQYLESCILGKSDAIVLIQ